MEEENTSVKTASRMMSSQSGIGRRVSLAKESDRLMVTNLVMENFKSYAGVQEIGPLHQCFTAVVGPNGSGKSNVIDAILFVFGHQAKKLRHARLSELIHKSDAHPDCPYAKVSVHFQRIINTSEDGSTFDVVKGSEFVVSRTAFKDNSSKYHYGEKVVSRGEVVEILKKHGIDMDNNRFLILQGEVEHIATMKPKAANPGDDNGLLEYLEDIIGSNRFVEPIGEATKALEILGIERTRRLNRLRIVEKEKIQLEVAKIQAEDHISKLKSSFDKKALLYQHERWKVRQEASRIEVKHHELLEVQKARKMAMQDREREIVEMEEKVSVQSKAVAVASKKLEKVKAKLKLYENQDVTLQEQVKTLQSRQKKLEKQIKTETAKFDEKSQTIETSTADQISLTSKIQDSETLLANLESSLETMRSERSSLLAPLHSQMAAEQRSLMPFKEEIAKAEASLDLAQSQLDSLVKRAEESKSQLSNAKFQISELSSKSGKVEEFAANLERELKEKMSQLQESEKELQSLKQKDGELASLVIEKRGQIEEASRVKHSTGILANLRKMVPQQVSAGILGKLGDLGEIEEKYDTAVTTACGALEHIVVTNSDVAQTCVDVLKSKKLGRATFIIINEIRDAIEPQLRRMEEGQIPPLSHRLFDLITPDSDDAKLAFYHALQDTLVCEDLETASSLAFGKQKRWRVVTTSGALFDFAGTISGGGQQRASGGMRVVKAGSSAKSASESKKSKSEPLLDVAALKATLEQLNAELRELRTSIARTETTVATLKAAVAKLQRSAETAASEVVSVATQRATLEASLGEWQEEAEAREAECAAAREAFEIKSRQISAELKAARAAAAAGEAKVAQLTAQMEEASGEALRTAEREHATLQEKVEEWRSALTKATVAIASAQKAIAKAEDAKAKAEAEMKELVDVELKELKRQLNALTDDALAASALQEEAGTLFSQENRLLSTLQESLDSLKSNIRGDKEAQFQQDSSLSTVTAQLQEQRELIKILTLKLAELAKKKMDLKVGGEDLEIEVEEEDGENGENSEIHKKSSTVGKKSNKMDEDVVQDDPVASSSSGPISSATMSGIVESSEKKDSVVEKRKGRRVVDSIDDDLELKEWSDDELSGIEDRELKAVKLEINRLHAELDGQILNVQAILDYRAHMKVYMVHKREVEEIHEQFERQHQALDSLRKQRLDCFMEGHSKINPKLKEMYTMITISGSADLEISNSTDPFLDGITFSVRPPNKSWRPIQNLSGGEKTLSSLALVFALHYYKPTPLYVMDEIDAALDFKNVSIVANYIKERTKDAQFLIVSLRNFMFELADRLVGIYKTDNATKSVTINPSSFSLPKP
jgi:structural maintenance of chromosome 4